MAEFDEDVILITGAASGIGAASASTLAAQGAARLILCDLDEAGLQSLAATLPCPADLHVGDISAESFWDGIELAGLTRACVNAGISSAGAIAEMDYAEWRHVLGVNLDGAFLTLRAAMRAIGATGKGGAIVLTASVSGLKAEPGTAAYGASKAALIHLAKVAAKEGAPERIRVNAIAPGGVQTPIWSRMDFFQQLVAEQGSEAAAFDALAQMATPLGRYAEAGEIAGQIAFLLSDRAALVTGACLVSDGGYSL